MVEVLNFLEKIVRGTITQTAIRLQYCALLFVDEVLLLIRCCSIIFAIFLFSGLIIFGFHPFIAC